MRYTEIDGHKVEVESCEDCPLREVQMDSGYNYLIRIVCRHPNNDGEEIDAWGPSSDCPLREVKE